MPELVLLSEGTPILRCPLHGQTLRVGRSAANDIALPDEDTPPWLCSFEKREGEYYVVPRGGKEIKVNDRAHAGPLRDGDIVSLGRLRAKYEYSAPAKELTRRQQRTGILTQSRDGLALTELQIVVGAEAPRSIPADGLRVGADKSNDIIIQDGYVSNFHAQIFPKGERLFVRDLDSTNGTRVDDVRIVEAEVVPGCALTFGQTRTEVISHTQTLGQSSAEVGPQGPWTCGAMVSADPICAKVFRLIEKVAVHDATACVFGETGCGKELAARALHDLSGRAAESFVPLNCAAIPETLLESTLFGHEKGAFTGADKARAGVFEQAQRGSLFLDEIGELPVEMQAKLLRVLETRTVRRLGGHTDISLDVRIICATHRDLVAHVAAGKFREDLLHRLYVIPIRIPPLRERPMDIPHLADHFVSSLSATAKPLSDSAHRKLTQHSYPGNVRELRNVIQRALILAEGDEIGENDIEFIPTTLQDMTQSAKIYTPGMKLEDIERRAFTEIMAVYPSASKAAKALGMSKTTFWRKAKALGVLDKDGDNAG